MSDANKEWREAKRAAQITVPEAELVSGVRSVLAKHGITENPMTLTDAQVEAFAIRAAKGNNGGEWLKKPDGTQHYTEAQKDYWRQWVRDFADAIAAPILEAAAEGICPICKDGGCDLETMCIYSPPGTKVQFKDVGGYSAERESASTLLAPNAVLTVQRVDVHDWSTEVYFEEVKGAFNSVMFGRSDA